MPPKTCSVTTTMTIHPAEPSLVPHEGKVSPSKNCQSHPALYGSLTPPDTYQGPIRNFGPGPTSLPREVEAAIQTKCFASLTENDLNDKRPRLSTMFLSHRSPEFAAILEETVNSTRRVLEIPNDYEVLFLQGGGHGQFAAVPLNLCSCQKDVATYLVTGSWSARALEEAHKHCSPQNIDWRSTSSTNDDDTKQVDIDPNSKYIYVCSNETVDGIEIHKLTDLREQLQSSTSSATSDIPLVVDASSDVASKPIEWNDANVGIYFAGASKNIGIPGVTLVVIRKDLLLLLGNFRQSCPGILDYRLQIESSNMYNTVPTFNVHVVGLMMEWILSLGGISAMEERSRTKSQMVYDVIHQSNGFYTTTNHRNENNDPDVAMVLQPSRMNVPFSLVRDDLTDCFLIEAWKKGIVGLRTLTPFSASNPHQLRASLYHGVSLEDVTVLVDFMVAFAEKHRKSPCIANNDDDEKKEAEERVIHKGRQNMVLTTSSG